MKTCERRAARRLTRSPQRRAGTMAASLAIVLALPACQSAGDSGSDFDNPIFSDETRALEKQLDAEAAALGTAQAAMSMPAAWDPTGDASLVTTPAGLAARQACSKSADARLNAQLEKDQQELYRKYGLNPDGSPSGRKPTGK